MQSFRAICESKLIGRMNPYITRNQSQKSLLDSSINYLSSILEITSHINNNKEIFLLYSIHITQGQKRNILKKVSDANQEINLIVNIAAMLIHNNSFTCDDYYYLAQVTNAYWGTLSAALIFLQS